MRKNNTSNTNANVEQDLSNAPLGAQKMPRFNTPVCISVHSYRARLADPDGISAKAAIDGIVKAGILEDDSAKYVKKVEFSQELSKDEQTIIYISED